MNAIIDVLLLVAYCAATFQWIYYRKRRLELLPQLFAAKAQLIERDQELIKAREVIVDLAIKLESAQEENERILRKGG
jgi:hypothetical protein